MLAMPFQRNCNVVVAYFRPNGVYFPLSGSLFFLLILIVSIVQQTTARPSQDEDLSRQFAVDDKLKDIDNLETHRAKLVNGVVQNDHPIIIYKEDFVSEDYVAPPNESKLEKHKRRYKDIAHRRRHHGQNLTDVVIEEKPDKILFDIIPEKPLIVPEDMEENYPKSHMQMVPLIDDSAQISETNDEKSSLKEELQKKPKKFHRRARRNANTEHILRKRNPYFRHIPKTSGELPTQVQYIYVKHSVAGKKHNGLDIPVPGPKPLPTVGPNENIPISFDSRVAADENDRVVFSGGRTTPIVAQGTTESIFRHPRPENFDFSFMNSNINSKAVAPTRRPQPTTQAGISQCVWAIVNCCSNRNSEIRYACFEQNGCEGAFWDLNPCADNVRDTFINIVADYYN